MLAVARSFFLAVVLFVPLGLGAGCAGSGQTATAPTVALASPGADNADVQYYRDIAARWRQCDVAAARTVDYLRLRRGSMLAHPYSLGLDRDLKKAMDTGDDDKMLATA